jgi:hypothetical protein
VASEHGQALVPSPEAKLQARVAGFAYLLTIACGLFAEAFVRGSIRSADPLRTAEALRDLEQLYRLGVLADGVMLMSYVVVTAMLYRLFKPINASFSFLAALFSLVGIAMLAASMTILLLPIQQGGAIAYDALRAHGATYSLTGLFFGPYCVLIGGLVLRSRWLPAWIGWLMMAAGALFVLDASIELAAPAAARRIPDAVMLISLLAEGSLAICLAAFGVRPAGLRLAQQRGGTDARRP